MWLPVQHEGMDYQTSARAQVPFYPGSSLTPNGPSGTLVYGPDASSTTRIAYGGSTQAHHVNTPNVSVQSMTLNLMLPSSCSLLLRDAVTMHLERMMLANCGSNDIPICDSTKRPRISVSPNETPTPTTDCGSNSECESPRSDRDADTDSLKSNRISKSLPGNQAGERRLSITFECLGRIGKTPQVHGRQKWRIPDHLEGMFTLYHEEWRTKITFFEPSKTQRDAIRIKWTVTNVATGVETFMIESDSDAVVRQMTGRTITNHVFKKAMEARLATVRAQLAQETNELKRKHILAHMKALMPVRFTLGPLAFGLLHTKVIEMTD